jgi:hypothetical protein
MSAAMFWMAFGGATMAVGIAVGFWTARRT